VVVVVVVVGLLPKSSKASEAEIWEDRVGDGNVQTGCMIL